MPRAVLVGPMGAGKTTVAGLLGEAWQVPVRDTDADIEASTGREISDIFVESGEETTAHHQRSDVCAVPAAGIVAEAMVALVLADAVLEKFGGDSVQETRRNAQSYLDTLRFR